MMTISTDQRKLEPGSGSFAILFRTWIYLKA
jgi:hypothetical protein